MDFSKVPVERLLNRVRLHMFFTITERNLTSSLQDYLKERAALFSPASSNTSISHGFPYSSSDTVLFTVTDAEGNAASYIQSVYTDFGTHAVPKGCGFALQNRGCNFVLEEGHPNCLGPSRRPYHTILPAMVTRGDQPGGDLFMSTPPFLTRFGPSSCNMLSQLSG